MRNLSLSKYVFHTYCSQSIIILDLKRDKYYIFNDEFKRIVDKCIRGEISGDGGSLQSKDSPLELSPREKEILSLLLKKKLFTFERGEISSKNVQPPGGAKNIDWNLSREMVEVEACPSIVLNAFLTLLKIHLSATLLGFFGIYKSVNKASSPKCLILRKKYTPSLKDCVVALNKACQIFPKGTKCLEWSASLVILARTYKFPCQLVVGVQNFPFKAHAWVELNGEVIADDPSLPFSLGIILKTPSRA